MSVEPGTGARSLALIVAVPTYRRPDELRRGLPHVVEQAVALADDPDSHCTVSVIVVDNDAAGSARPVVAQLGQTVGYLIEADPGISAARNRALDEAAEADVLVFLDDDEVPHPGWLAALLATYRRTGAAAVMGPVVPFVDGNLDPWIAAGPFFGEARRPTGTEIPVAAAGNLLLDMRRIRSAGLRFDPRLGLTGGEDTLFSKQLVKAGERIVWCDEAVADDHVPATRMTREWVLRRAWRTGLSAASTDLYLADTARGRLAVRARWLWHGCARVGAGMLRYGLGLCLRSTPMQAGGLRVMRRGRGMLAGARGVVYEEYGRPSG